jgi:hypothetical protein
MHVEMHVATKTFSDELIPFIVYLYLSQIESQPPHLPM